jgi:hypothetical protein
MRAAVARIHSVGPSPSVGGQFANIGREIGQADQKVGTSAFDRYNDLLREFAAIKKEVEAIVGSASQPEEIAECCENSNNGC